MTTTFVGSAAEWNALSGLGTGDVVVLTADIAFATNPSVVALADATLRGNGHTLTLEENGTGFVGLLSLAGGSVYDVNIDTNGTQVTVSHGYLMTASNLTTTGRGNIYGCRVTAATITANQVAGLVGMWLPGGSGEIVGCRASATISGTYGAGIAYAFGGTSVRHCEFVGTLSGLYSAGIISNQSISDAMTITDCHASCVSAGIYSGGIVGWSERNVTVTRCTCDNVPLIGFISSRTPVRTFDIDHCYVRGEDFINVVGNTGGGGAVAINIDNCYIADAYTWFGDVGCAAAGPVVTATLNNTFRNGSRADIATVTDDTNFVFTEGANVSDDITALAAAVGGNSWDADVWAVDGVDRLVLRTFQNIDPDTGAAYNDEFRDTLWDADEYDAFDATPVLNGKAYLQVPGATHVANASLFTTLDSVQQALALPAATTTLSVDLYGSRGAPSGTVLLATSDPTVLTLVESSKTVTEGSTQTFAISIQGNGTVTLTLQADGAFVAANNMLASRYVVTISDYSAPDANVPCFAGWMQVDMARTRRRRCVRELRAGHVILDHAGQPQVIQHMTTAATYRITRIPAHRLRPGLPSRDLVLTPNHLVYHPHGFWVRAAQLGRTMTLRQPMTVYHVCLQEWSSLDMANLRVETCAWRPEHHRVRPAV